MLKYLRRSVGLLGLVAVTAHAAVAPKKVLFFSKSSNFEHSVIRERDGEPSYVARVLRHLGPEHAIEFTFSKDGSLFSPSYLAQFNAVCFFTSGDLLSAGKDGNPPMTPAGKQALLDAVQNGLGFVGVHSATDTFHTDETAETDTNRPRTWRYQNRGDKADPYTRMIGGELMVHGTQQLGHVRLVDPKFPGFAGKGESLELMEEWYSMTNFAPDMHVLLLLDTGSMRDPNANGKNWPPAGWDTPYKRAPFPSTWARMQGRGRVFYTGLGHREEMWLSPIFQDFLFGGIAWAVGDVEADVTPNLAQVAPGARELPPVSGPVSGLPKALKDARPPKIPW